MHSSSVDSRPPFATLSLSDSANSPEQPEDADPEADSVGFQEKAGVEFNVDGCVLEEREQEQKQEQEQEQEQELENTEIFSQNHTQTDHCRRQPVPRPAKPFQKWIRTLHKRALRQQEILGYDGSLPEWLHETENAGSQARGSAHHRHSSSDSSFACVTAVKSASISLTGVSLLTRSRKTTIHGPRTDRSSRASVSGPRLSEDSFCPETQAPVDPAVIERALQRRRILDELISTEESYIGDVRFLMNVYVTILASLPTSPAGLRCSVNQNLNDIVELHEEVLGELRRAVPDSEDTQPDLALKRTQSNRTTRGHRRWRSLDAVPEGTGGSSWLRDLPGMGVEPQTTAEIAKIFSKRMNRFFIYEEYGAKYELMIKDVATAHRTMPGWSSYQKGLEVLASSLGSADSRDDRLKKALTIGDLLVKPIQRVCKYPLLFSELLKQTPVIDCPYSHMEIENTLIRLREATAEINRATNDSRTKLVLEKTWILQDRLAFPNQLDAASKNRIRSFGHLKLCGALHVCWQTKEGASGQYMAALLYREWLCLATAGRNDQIYTIQACIALANIKVEEVDNGRGLQCHTTRHSWKIVFLSDNQLYELILTACSPKEELEWCTRLRSRQQAANPEGQDQMQSDMFSFVSLNIKTLGTVFRKPGTIARKISIHRATTIGPKSPLYQVILKNTSAAKGGSASTHSPINRSQSLLTTNSRIPVLAPARAERARLEALLSDVWTRDVLPFPGITARSRSEHLVRASASSMMRKLSAVSITGSFTRRSASLASLPHKEKGGAAAAAAIATTTTAVDVKRRTSDGAYPKLGATVVHTQYWNDICCASPVVLSAIADQTERPQTAAARPASVTPEKSARGAAANADAEAQAEAHPRASSSSSSSSSSSGGSVLLLVRKSSGHSSSSRPSLQHSNLGGDMVSASARGEAERKLETTTRGRADNNTNNTAPSRTRSRRFSGKLGKAGGVRRREVVVEEIRSWFR